MQLISALILAYNKKNNARSIESITPARHISFARQFANIFVHIGQA